MKWNCVQQLTSLLLCVFCFQHAKARSLRQSVVATDCQDVNSITELGQIVSSFEGSGSAQLCLQQLSPSGSGVDTCAPLSVPSLS